jgi:ribosome-binding ATPase
VALEVGIVGPSGSGKTSLFTALTKAGGGEYGKTNVGVAPIADERLGVLAEVVHARKVTPATIRIQDIPGSAAFGDLRQVDALLVVVRAAAELESFELELLVADRDHVERRLERVEKQAKSGDPRLRAEVEELTKVLAHVDAGRTLRDYPGELPGELEPLTTKPLIAIENGPAGIDLQLEAELAELSDEEAAEFRGSASSALDDVARRLHDALDLITFFTAGEKETRAWTLRNGETALDAAESIHSDIARGFIRCEVIDWRDLADLGSHAEVAKHGKQRLEGKTYVVRDGDVLNIRFNV